MSRGPGIIDRVNFVTEMWNNPCDVPWVLYVETAIPAALDAFIAVICFDIGDVLRFVFRPANLRSGRHSRGGRKGRHGRKPKGIRARLTNKLPAFKALTQRKVVQGVKNLWIIDGIGQRLMWWWLVVDIATFTAYNWTSAIYKTERCQMGLGPGGLLRENNGGTYIGILDWNNVGFPILKYETGSITSAAFAWSFGPGVYNVVAGLNVTNTGSLDTFVQLRIVYTNTPPLKNTPSDPVFLRRGESTGLLATSTAKGPGNGNVEVFVDQGSIDAEFGNVAVIGRPPHFPAPIKFKCNSPFFPP